ncbi:hypothetical protein [Caballeronia sp. GAFFF3]|uniref:hypothetical protein n=1 Tax=Caballeronia sp. GAFFF3 TaxID=2921759 RepID=UPI002027D8C9|nr:hypothetical protein [Caballeronia sp. GAFFF3]
MRLRLLDVLTQRGQRRIAQAELFLKRAKPGVSLALGLLAEKYSQRLDGRRFTGVGLAVKRNREFVPARVIAQRFDARFQFIMNRGNELLNLPEHFRHFRVDRLMIQALQQYFDFPQNNLMQILAALIYRRASLHCFLCFPVTRVGGICGEQRQA